MTNRDDFCADLFRDTFVNVVDVIRFADPLARPFGEIKYASSGFCSQFAKAHSHVGRIGVLVRHADLLRLQNDELPFAVSNLLSNILTFVQVLQRAAKDLLCGNGSEGVRPFKHEADALGQVVGFCVAIADEKET